MNFIRRIDDADAFETGYAGHRIQVLSHLESALFFASTIEEGCGGSGLHYHESDQVYFVLSGALTLRLGDDVETVEAGSLVHVPAGLAHRKWNEGPGPETHLEIVVPPSRPGTPIAFGVDTPADVPVERRASAPGTTVRVSAERLDPLLPGLGVQALLSPDAGIDTAGVYYVEAAADSTRRRTHLHEFDQYYFVLEGQLTVEVGLQRLVADRHSLVVLPTGVPHCVYNGGVDAEAHLAMDIPPPAPAAEWEHVVRLTAEA